MFSSDSPEQHLIEDLDLRFYQMIPSQKTWIVIYSTARSSNLALSYFSHSLCIFCL